MRHFVKVGVALPWGLRPFDYMQMRRGQHSTAVMH
jgi:hypothetical protein